jgi:hypothetical protein
MTTTPDSPEPTQGEDQDVAAEAQPKEDAQPKEGVGAEIGMSPGEGSTFEPEEDPGA